MKLNFLTKSSNKVTDLVCLMKVEKDEKAITYSYKGKTYYFCSENCREEFKQDPEKYLS
ncbi:MAG: Heavy metal translocating P-type ATPase [Candidatus Curtissbacteria bacterium GW2011_GWA1_40_47]|nr:MAG: Heavy metal translocating P-type ATPase [Candidatus Curtissbacteria bacterium GW2011_GWB1_40_28]KKR60908.1 MAG: Heavy metal translocating P-type ATPase [Candidatus Curtissbacteria bacterium GW2011_GWA2_40_31]KKR61459.1 MAG: Heavy metal translocating P-type ATPase [Microgenomates group bacterium GW2011_GWC1_40_35]KKR65248.1 MAG: Heavy metal translocating P-type ATPase [Candidatus Curtissbacteria bacterium GW2011_GWA1_40_47]KKR77607.1 MAG: Heavy metal translocating P-type ATPase [Candidat